MLYVQKCRSSIQAYSGPETLIFPYFGFSIITTISIDVIGSWSTTSASQVIGIIFSMHSNKARQTCWRQHYTVMNFVPGWDHWPTLRCPEAIPMEERVRGLFPIYRLSNNAIRAIDNAYRKGWAGHYEVTIPTILDQANMTLEDIGGNGSFVHEGNENQFYTNSPAISRISARHLYCGAEQHAKVAKTQYSLSSDQRLVGSQPLI